MTTQSPATETLPSLTVNGRQFAVTAQATQYDARRYTLTGKRGAVYTTIRNARRPDQMFLVSPRGRGLARGLSRGIVWLTDANGSLEVIR